MLSKSRIKTRPAQLGCQRDWVWRGWQIRYTYLRAEQKTDRSVPLLFVHGFGSALTQWHANLLPLSQTHTVYALDLLGFGASEKADADYKVGLWVEQVYEFWRTMIGRPVVLVGHSLGALVALTAATRHPEMIQGLVLMTLPSTRQELLPPRLQPIVGTIERAFSSPLLLKPLFRLVRQPKVVRAILLKAYADAENVTEELIANTLLPIGDRGAAQTFCRLSQAVTRPDYSPSAKTLLPLMQRPALLLWGAQDRIVPLAQGQPLLQQFPNLQMVEIPNAGHCLYDERPEQVNAEILTWVERCVEQLYS